MGKIDDFTLWRALYGDLQMIVRNEEGFPADWGRKPNGFFLGTTRVSAVVFERMRITKDEIFIERQVFPTNNPQANVLSLKELKLFGTVTGDLESLCAEHLGP